MPTRFVLSSAEILAPGTRLGRYELVQRLAVGGMAELYLARVSGIEGFEKLVALKRILPQYAGNEELIAMFLDEARLAATLQHANVAQVYDIGHTRHGLFFTMEFVHGEDVRNLLRACARREERVPLAHALTIVTGAAAGLHAAHVKTGLDGTPLGIVHRDVSPSNILVSFDGCVKVIDFGVAKAAGRRCETRSGTLKGKIAYMSPEQCRGEAVDRRSDVFGLGIVLYELVTGTRLFQGPNEFAILQQIVTAEVVPPSRHRPGLPAELDRIVLTALANDPAARYASAQELQLDLERFATEQSLPLSTTALGAYVRVVFSDRPELWQQLELAAQVAPVLRLPLRAPAEEDEAGTILSPDDAEADLEGSEPAVVEATVLEPSALMRGATRSRFGAALFGAAVVAVSMLGWFTVRGGHPDAVVVHEARAPRAQEVTAVDEAETPTLEVAGGTPGQANGDTPPTADRPAAPGQARPLPARPRAEPRRARAAATREQPNAKPQERAPRRAPPPRGGLPPSWDPDSPLPPR